jgi:formamidopyrimidine-DNA glycosylase
MPELPDIEAIRQALAPRLAGVEIVSAQILRPVVVRNLLGGDFAPHLVGRRLAGVGRRGKFLLLPLAEPAVWLVINPMLAGRLHYGEPLPRSRKRDALVIGLAGGHELRYHDARDMGKIYLTGHLDQVPGLSGLGPDADEPALTLETFRERIRRHTGEIKGVLTEQSFVAGIGNAYSDEICWHARLYPFRRRASLSTEDVAHLYVSMRQVLASAVEILQVRVADAIDVEIRDFLAVHGKPGQPCPRCGTPISEVTRQKRSTHFCRTCQPGLMVGGRDRSLK